MWPVGWIAIRSRVLAPNSECVPPPNHSFVPGIESLNHSEVHPEMDPERRLASPRLAGRGRSEGDRVEVVVEPDRHRVIIHSTRGISAVTLECLGEKWPEHVVVQMRLKGLENLTVSAGELAVQAAVSSGGGQSMIRQWPDRDEQVELTANDPLWLDLRVIPAPRDEAPEGFEWTVPWGLRQANPRQIRVNFIDFYR